ncbi:unnamed protein product [Sphagnum tenellum]
MGLVSMSFNPSDDAVGAKAMSNHAGCSGHDTAPRWKREDYVHVKHDKLFSDWKVLVGPSDWRDHAAGKEGVQRYRVQNLPGSHCGPGVYELGVTGPAWLPVQQDQAGLGSNKLRSKEVVAVFVGQSDNVRQRLQRYGQAGGHLEGAKSGGEPMSPEHSSGSRSPRGPRLFTEVFALGCSVAFRWAATDSKAVAEKVEEELLEAFDYAWNKAADGTRRSRDVLAKILIGVSSSSETSSCMGDSSLQKKWLCFGVKRVGIQVAVRKPSRTVHDDAQSATANYSRRKTRCDSPMLWTRAHPNALTVGLGTKAAKVSEFTKLEIPAVVRCGFVLDNGVPCSAIPGKGRKRCTIHKDTKTTRNHRRSQAQVASTSPSHSCHPNLPSSRSSATDFRGHAAHRNSSSRAAAVARSSSSKSHGALACCLPFLGHDNKSSQHSAAAASAAGKQPPEVKRRGSLSFNTWLRTSELRRSQMSGAEWTMTEHANQLKLASSRTRSFQTSVSGGKRSSSKCSSYTSSLPTCKESETTRAKWS